jgi:hypothetical protein
MADFAQLENDVSKHRTSLFWGPDYHLVLYPLAQREQFNIALFTEFSLPLEDGDTPEVSNKSLRQPRVQKVQETSQKNGKVFHMSPPTSWARDAVVSRLSAEGHLERLDWIYAHDPFEGMLS